MDSLLYQLVSGAVAAYVLVVWVRPETFKWLMDQDTGYPSSSRRAQETAMVTSTWALVTLTLKNNVAEWLFVGYMIAWAGAQFGSIWLKMKGQSSGTTVTTHDASSSKTETKS